MKDKFKPLSPVITLILLALGMVVLIIVIPIVNPANKPISELVPAIIMCAVICLGSISLIIYFTVPKKIKTNAIPFLSSEEVSAETMSCNGEYWKGETNDDIKIA